MATCAFLIFLLNFIKSITPSIALSMINRHAIVTPTATGIDDELGVTKLVNFSVVVVGVTFSGAA